MGGELDISSPVVQDTRSTHGNLQRTVGGESCWSGGQVRGPSVVPEATVKVSGWTPHPLLPPGLGVTPCSVPLRG